MKFASPSMLQWLWALIPGLLLILSALKRRERLLARLVDNGALPHLSPYRNASRKRTRALLFLCAALLMIGALAGPQWGFHWQEVKQRGLDIVVLLDTSNSMLTEDLKPNRLQQAKWGIRDLVTQLKGDRIGLIAFAGESFLQCPLTIDYAAFLLTLEDIYAGIIPRGGTAIAQALENAIDAFDTSGEADRVIILITDGENHEGDPLALVDELKKKNIRVFAAGVGTPEGDLVPATENGPGGYLKDRQGQVVKSALQENTLQQLALATDGMYIRSSAGDIGLDRIYSRGIAQLQRDERESRMMKAYEHRFVWFLLAAFLILVLEAVLGERSRQPVNSTAGVKS
jgi:Ca-activated chloride channel family protein